MNDRQPVDVLLIDPDDADVRRVAESLETGTVPNRIHTVAEGAAAIDFLRRRGAYENAPRPDLVLLELDLPDASGHDVLAEITEDDTLAATPVIVFANADGPEAVARSYDLLANAYVQKPDDPAAFEEVVDAIAAFWLKYVWYPLDRDGVDRGGPT